MEDRRIRTKVIAIIILAILLVIAIIGMLLIPSAIKKPEPTPTPTLTPTPTVVATPEPTPEPTPIPTADADATDSIQKVVNRNHTVEADYVPSDLVLVTVESYGDQYLRSEANSALEQMLAAAQAENIYMRVLSGYRSYEEQVSLYNTYVNKYGITYTERMDSHPGFSEHQLGLAVDLGNFNQQCDLQFCFDEYASSVWLVKNAYLYGFIQRYPLSTEPITGIIYSPWHYRYVGVEEATKIHDSGMTMDEFYDRK